MAEDHLTEVELVVESVRAHMLTDRHVVILKDASADRYLPIWIGRWEASAIAAHLQGHVPERPMTHDLLATLLRETGAGLERIRITALRRDTFHARLVLRVGDATREIDARPSDAIALALRLGAPIFAAPGVLAVASIAASDVGDPPSPGASTGRPTPGGGRTPAAASALEVTGEPIDPARLDVFRDFVNSLWREGDQRGRPDLGS